MRRTEPHRIPPAVASRIESQRARGTALAEPLRHDMERVLGPLPAVRLHTGPAAADLAGDLDALAFTSGRDVFFAANAFQPATHTGRRLLAHELAHVLQQPVAGPARVVEHHDGPQEREAQSGARPRTAAAPGAVQRAPAAHEREWAAENPEGRVEWSGRDRIVLWNFDVGRAELKPAHKEAVVQLAETFRSAMLGDPAAVIEIDGHASRSGGGELNEAIAADRAAQAVYELVDRRLPPERLRLKSYGFTRPWLPNVSGAVMARNRRVELRILRFREPPPPAPRPELRPPPERTAPPAEPKFEWAKDAPTTAFEVEFEIPVAPITVGLVKVYPSGKLKFKFRARTQNKEEIKLGFNPTKGEFKTAVTAKVQDWGEIKLQESKGKIQVGFGFPMAFGRPEVGLETDPKAPVVLKFKSGSTPIAEGLKIQGVAFDVTVEGEGQFKFGPSEQAIAQGAQRIGQAVGTEAAAGGAAAGVSAGAVAAAAGVVVITVAWLAWGFHVMNEAHRQGRERGATMHRRRGFCYRLAGEISPDLYGQAFNAVDSDFDRTYYRERYEGWYAAQGVISRTSPASEALERLRRRYAGWRSMLAIVEDLMGRIGGGKSAEDVPLPATLDEIR